MLFCVYFIMTLEYVSVALACMLLRNYMDALLNYNLEQSLSTSQDFSSNIRTIKASKV